jgi:hypothetical protein
MAHNIRIGSPEPVPDGNSIQIVMRKTAMPPQSKTQSAAAHFQWKNSPMPLTIDKAPGTIKRATRGSTRTTTRLRTPNRNWRIERIWNIDTAPNLKPFFRAES